MVNILLLQTVSQMVTQNNRIMNKKWDFLFIILLLRIAITCVPNTYHNCNNMTAVQALQAAMEDK